MRVRIWRPFLLVVVALALPVSIVRPAGAATGPRERAALVQLFATDAALASAREREQVAQSRLTRVQADLRGLRRRLAAARINEGASQRALALRLNEIYRARPLDALAVLLESRSWSDVSAGLDLLDRLSQSDSALVRSARRWHTALRVQARTLKAAEAGANAQQAAWEARVSALQGADRIHRALLARLQRQRVHAVAALATTAHRDVQRARRVVRPQPHGGGSTSSPLPPPPPKPPSLAPGSTLSVSSTAYSLPGRTASGLPVGPGICATDPRVIPLGTRFEVPGYGPCVAADTGSAIIGATIDLWMPNERATVYGTQTITIIFR
ncbi:MAG TPA: 3D domain-containing protein [Gaiellales bacterium]|nr:3D domain-containing protein [Gaiellales bacterium]